MHQCQKPTGWRGRLVIWMMNAGHSRVTNWGLTHVAIAPHETILDVGCGGGRTVGKLAAIATQGKVYGVDFSDESVAASTRGNADAIASGRVEISPASVSQLPFRDGTFDLVTAVETHFWWPDLPHDLREVFRVLKPGGRLLIVAEVYRRNGQGRQSVIERQSERIGLKLLTADEHRQLLAEAGFSDVQAIEHPKGWIAVIGARRA